MLKWYYAALKNYAVFSGRATRGEFWYFITLLNMIFTILLGILDVVTGSYLTGSGIWFLSGGYALALFLPSISSIDPETS